MNIQSAIIQGTNILKSRYILTAQLDTEILMAKALGEDRKYIILNSNKDLQDENFKYFRVSSIVGPSLGIILVKSSSFIDDI